LIKGLCMGKAPWSFFDEDKSIRKPTQHGAFLTGKIVEFRLEFSMNNT